MVTDVQNTFLNAALNTGAPASFQGTGSYDLWGGQTALPVDAIGNTINIDPGLGWPLRVLFEITTAVTSGGAATVQFQLLMSDDAAQTVNATVVASTRVWGKASLVVGFKDRLVVPPNVTQRFLGIQYVVGTAALTAGVLFAGLVRDEETSLPTQ